MTEKEYKKTFADYPSALNVKEVAEILRISTKAVYRIINNNFLPAIKVGREHRVAKSNLIKYLRAAERSGTNPKCEFSDNTPKSSWTCPAVCGICVGAKPAAVPQKGQKT